MLIASPIANALHLLAAIVWVGGMFFAYLAARPAATALAPAERFPLWARLFARFFPWVWLAIALLLATGFWMIFADFGGFAAVGVHVHLMLGLGIVMMLLYGHMFFAPYRRFRAAVGAADWVAAGTQLGQIRRIFAINLALGLITAGLGNTGWHWA
ncbi:MAG: hypothetical protein FJX56_14980 [Alphaproteobacteria bacterium]|nr:hypothetical protein [Alphaproteobacteria bacterium]